MRNYTWKCMQRTVRICAHHWVLVRVAKLTKYWGWKLSIESRNCCTPQRALRYKIPFSAAFIRLCVSNMFKARHRKCFCLSWIAENCWSPNAHYNQFYLALAHIDSFLLVRHTGKSLCCALALKTKEVTKSFECLDCRLQETLLCFWELLLESGICGW